MLKKTIKLLYLALGITCTALGFIGAFLPVLPTTPFLLVALWAFSKSSPRLQHWLYNHPRYGKTLQNWFEYGIISTKIKTVAITAITFSIPTAYLITRSALVLFIHIPIVILTITYIYSRPSKIGSDQQLNSKKK
ncbi:MAG: uncharacterized membrane protein YbaN (DUF454 family) [Oceanicoccus sp.]|jgi:uncharacterized membrane protein YbaN (DUF454 family)